MDFINKTAVVTGAGSGIGQAVAKRLAKEGAKIALLDMNYDAAIATQEQISKNGGSAKALKVDVMSKMEVFAAAKSAFDVFGSIDYWVNCAGYSKITPFLDHTEEIWNKTIGINLTGMFFCCQAAVTYMKDNKEGGGIINFSSQSGKKGTTSYAAYCSSKFGVIGLTQSVAAEFAPKIRCNSICPSVVLTPMWDTQLDDYAKKRHIADEQVMPRFIQNTPLGRLCEYDDVTNLVVFLLSSNSSYMTGQALNLTGGACMY